MKAELDEIVHWLTMARAHAQVLAERHPSYRTAIRRFDEGVKRAQEELMVKVQPNLSQDETNT